MDSLQNTWHCLVKELNKMCGDLNREVKESLLSWVYKLTGSAKVSIIRYRSVQMVKNKDLLKQAAKFYFACLWKWWLGLWLALFLCCLGPSPRWFLWGSWWCFSVLPHTKVYTHIGGFHKILRPTWKKHGRKK